MSRVLHLECPVCGWFDGCDEDGCCPQCGRDMCWVYEDRRVYLSERISMAHWYHVVAEAAREYGAGYVTPALRELCKTKRKSDFAASGVLASPGRDAAGTEGAHARR